MSVWFCIPSARPVEHVEPVLAQWRERGYRVALWRDDTAPLEHLAEFIRFGEYPGYAQAVNALVADAITLDGEADWFVSGGDDTLPDPTYNAAVIAVKCSNHFDGTFGVMQPTGDRFAGGCIDRIAGSPWLGREWCLRANGGRGPFWPEYTHCFADEELQNVAIKLGVFWQRPDLVHKHLHFTRESEAIDARSVSKPIPAHLTEANSRPHWDKYQKLFNDRKAAGFPGHEPI